MPKLTVKGEGTFEVPEGKRLVLAIEDSGIDILHRCGGYARCTTCRVVFHDGEPDTMTVAERDKLTDNGKLGEFRLSCQIKCEHDMHVEPLLRSSTEGIEPGDAPEKHVTPEPEYVPKPENA